MMKKRILVFYPKSTQKPAGGPNAVCYFYNKEQEKRNDSYFELLDIKENNQKLHAREQKIKKLPLFLTKLYYNFKKVIKVIVLLYGDYPVEQFDFNKYDVVHFHTAISLYLYRKQLASFKGKVLIQSHTPQPPSHELIANLPTFIKYIIPNLRKEYERIDRYAFNRADYIIFPCPEAEEPYANNWPYYTTIKEEKKANYRYVLTGIPASFPMRVKEDIRTELNIQVSDFMICYVGRHNEVKGYDSLKCIGENILRQHNDTWVVCAGKEEPLKRLEHPRWVEIGWTTDAHSYINAADVFVLPNKETYFDIVMLEILSLGKIVIASRTGGNKYFEKMGCEGVLLYNTEDEAIKLLNKVKFMTECERMALGKKNKEFYEKYHTVAVMYDSYIDLLKEITSLL